MNILSWAINIMKFLLVVHYYSCGWLWLQENKSNNGLSTVGFSDDTSLAKYVDSLYLVTTTITTVGYGDFKAVNSDEAVWM